MSKSNRSLDAENGTDGSPTSEAKAKKNLQVLGNGKQVSATVISAKDHFMRRSSRTSFTEIDMVNFDKLDTRHFNYHSVKNEYKVCRITAKMRHRMIEYNFHCFSQILRCFIYLFHRADFAEFVHGKSQNLIRSIDLTQPLVEMTVSRKLC